MAAFPRRWIRVLALVVVLAAVASAVGLLAPAGADVDEIAGHGERGGLAESDGSVTHAGADASASDRSSTSSNGPSMARASADDGPIRAEAGVDQDVTRGATALLDATESWSPAGDLVRYDWTVESPLNETIDVECEIESCRLANVYVPEMGTYEITLEVEDAAGRTETDAIYVETEAANEFDVELTGPSSSGTVDLSADVDAGNATLEELLWIDQSGVVENESLSGLGEVHEYEASAGPGETVAVVVTAADGRVVSDTWTAPTPSGIQDYPYIEGPTELTGQASYDEDRDRFVFYSEQYRVRTANWLDGMEAVWNRDGDSVGGGRTFTDHFVAGEHTLEVTLKFADMNVDLGALDSVPGDVTHNLRAFYGDDSAEITVEADPAPYFDTVEVSHSGEIVTVRVDVEERYKEVARVAIEIDGTTVHSERNSGEVLTDQIDVSRPSGAYGRTPVTVVAEDGGGQESSETRYVSFPSQPPDDGDESNADDGESDDSTGDVPICPGGGGAIPCLT